MSPARPLWRGRALALVAIVLLALNLRTAVAALSPLFGRVSADIPLDSVGVGFIGMLPPIAFASAGFITPFIARRLGIELTLVVATAAMVLGPVVRALAPGYAVLAIGTALVLFGMGMGNIVLPPAVKKYFPDRIGQLTTLYVTLMSIGTAIPPLVAAPLADAAGWRASLAAWALVAVLALVPWLALRVRGGPPVPADTEGLEVVGHGGGRIIHSRVAWAITGVFVIVSFNAYATFAWLPEILADLTGATATEGGALLSLFAIMGLPTALVVPMLATRLRNVGWLVVAGVVLFVGGYAGLALVPTAATWLWVSLIGLGALLFPLCLVLINLRTRSVGTSSDLSGFVQGIGYLGGALGPLLVGVVHDLTGGWGWPLVLLAVVCLPALGAAVLLARPISVEEDLADRAQRRASDR